MASVYGIKKRLEQNNVDEKTVKEIMGNSDLVGIILRMEKLLDHDMMVQILDSCGCGGGKEYIKKCKEIGKALANKPLKEKIRYVNSDSECVVLNEDNTLTVSWHNKEGDKYRCACSVAVKKGVTVSDLAVQNNADDRNMPLTYCVCCAGAYRRHLQLQLGANLKIKEILASPINSRGVKPCEFILEIVE